MTKPQMFMCVEINNRDYPMTQHLYLRGRCICGRARVLCDMDPKPCKNCDCPNSFEDISHNGIRNQYLHKVKLFEKDFNLV